MSACLKQKVRCVIRYPNGLQFVGVNDCTVGDATVCPRVTAGCQTGEGYELCGPPIHAEQMAIREIVKHLMKPNAKPLPPQGGVAFLFGHDYVCRDCQIALSQVGVRMFAVTGEPA